jgi:hypothetical protein
VEARPGLPQEFRPERAGHGIISSEPTRAEHRQVAAIRRTVIASVAVLGASLAGLVFAVLLPICGIASIAEGLARWCWDLARRRGPTPRRDIVPHR